MQKFIADGCREALLEEKRRFCFLADKHCMFSYQISNFHEKVSMKGELPFTRGLFLKSPVSVCLPRPERCCPWSFLPGRRSAATSAKCQRRWRTWSRGCPPLRNHRRWSSAAIGWGWFLWYTSNCQGESCEFQNRSREHVAKISLVLYLVFLFVAYLVKSSW